MADTIETAKIGNLTVTVDYSDRRNEHGAQSYRWTVAGADGETLWTDADLHGPRMGADPEPREMLGTFLAFLSAALESRSYRQRTGREGENEDLFPPAMLDAFEGYADEVSMARIEIEEPDGYGEGE